MRFRSLCLALALVPVGQDTAVEPAVRQQAQDLLAREDTVHATGWDVIRTEVHLDLQPDRLTFESTATLELRATVPSDEVVLRLRAAELQQVTLADGTGLDHAFESFRAVIALPEEAAAGSAVTLRVKYLTSADQGFVQGTATSPGGALLLAPPGPQCASAWLPITQAGMDRATLSVDLDVPAELTTLAPGALHSSTRNGERRQDRWRLELPAPMDEWFLLVGTLERVDLGQVQERALAVLVERSLAPTAKQWLAHLGMALEHLERRFGSASPRPTFTVVLAQDLPAPGLDGAGALFLLDQGLTQEWPDPRATFGAVIPALARTWWGSQDHARPQDRWLVEGLAAYAEVLVKEDLGRLDEALARLLELQDRAVADWRDRPWSLASPEDRPEELAAGGASALHLLRHTIGDQAFFETLVQLGAGLAERSATTRNLLSLASVNSGQDLEAWAARWLHSPGLPDVVGRWSWDATTQELELQLQQVQAVNGPGDLGMDLIVACEGSFGRRRFRVRLDDRYVEARLPCPDRPDHVSWNEGLGLALFTGTQPDQESWHRALRNERRAAGRWQAARALGDPLTTGTEQSTADLAALARAACEDPSPVVRAQAIRSMGRSQEPVILNACKTVLLDPDRVVRVAAGRALGGQRGVGGAVGVLLDRMGSEPVAGVQAELVTQVAATGVPGTETVLGQIADAEGLPESVRGAALRGLVPVDPAGALRRARRFLESGPTLRVAARTTLAELAPTGADVRRLLGRQLEQPLLQDQFHTLALLAALSDPGHLPRLIRYHEQSPFEDLRRRARGQIRTILAQGN